MGERVVNPGAVEELNSKLTSLESRIRTLDVNVPTNGSVTQVFAELNMNQNYIMLGFMVKNSANQWLWWPSNIIQVQITAYGIYVQNNTVDINGLPMKIALLKIS